MKSGNRIIFSKLMALILVVMLMTVYLPTKAITAGGSIKVYLTVSDRGELAFDNNGLPMAWKAVTVTDLDGDGKYTVDEALKAAHKAYNTEKGYDSGSGYAKKVWGTEDPNGNFLFYINHEGLGKRITFDQVKNGDYLTASIYADSELYTDWYTTFDKDVKTVEAGKPFKLTLKGRPAYNPGDKDFVPLKGIDIIAYGKSDSLPATDANGTVELTINEPGTYVFSASGVTKGLWEDGDMKNSKPYGEKEMPEGAYWKYDDYYDSGVAVAYSQKDYGTNPCPFEELNWMDWGEWHEAAENPESPEFEEGYLLRSNKFIVDAPIMAPACVVTVKTSIADAKVTAAKATYNNGKPQKPALKVSIGSTELKKGSDYSVVYSNNVKAGSGKAILTGVGKYTGTKEVKFTIAKASQKPIIKAKKFKVSAQKLLETKVKVNIDNLVKTSKTNGKLKYSATIKNLKSKAVLSKKAGIITVKKKTKKGKYPVLVKVTAAGNSNYKSYTKTIKSYIVVK